MDENNNAPVIMEEEKNEVPQKTRSKRFLISTAILLTILFAATFFFSKEIFVGRPISDMRDDTKAGSTTRELSIASIAKNAPDAVSTSVSGRYVGTEVAGNFVWAPAMTLAWTDMKKNIAKEEIRLETDDPKAASITKAFNDPVITQKDLAETSYYVKSGFGQGVIDTINEEARRKFPASSNPGIGNVSIGPSDVVAFAYFEKKLEYEAPFDTESMKFNGVTVSGIKANTEKPKQYSTVKIIKYWNDDKFIIRLWLKGGEDELILAKGYSMTNLSEVLTDIKKYNVGTLETMENSEYEDYFRAPVLHMDTDYGYPEMVGKQFLNEPMADKYVEIMREIIKFDMDEVGVQLENKAYMVFATALPQEGTERQKRYFYLDKPYWIVMQQSSKTPNPYFILGVRNTRLMKVYHDNVFTITVIDENYAPVPGLACKIETNPLREGIDWENADNETDKNGVCTITIPYEQIPYFLRIEKRGETANNYRILKKMTNGNEIAVTARQGDLNLYDVPSSLRAGIIAVKITDNNGVAVRNAACTLTAPSSPENAIDTATSDQRGICYLSNATSIHRIRGRLFGKREGFVIIKADGYPVQSKKVIIDFESSKEETIVLKR